MNLKSMQKRTQTRGFSLTELAVVLAVVGSIIAGVWAAASDMNNNAKQEAFTEMLRNVVGNIRGNYEGKAYFESTDVKVMMPKLMTMGVFPSNTVRDSGGGVYVADSPFGSVKTAPKSPYNSFYVCGWTSLTSSSCDFNTGTLNSPPLFAVEVVFSNTKYCASAAMRNSSPLTVPGVVGVYVNGVLKTPPLNLGDIVTACGTKAPEVVDFVYRLTP